MSTNNPTEGENEEET